MLADKLTDNLKAAEDKIKEHTKFYTEVLKLVVAVFAGTLGGSIALLSVDKASAKCVILIAGGMLLCVALAAYGIYIYKIITSYLGTKPRVNGNQ